MNNKAIGTCKNCGELYCMECETWGEFCSEYCEYQYKINKDISDSDVNQR